MLNPLPLETQKTITRLRHEHGILKRDEKLLRTHQNCLGVHKPFRTQSIRILLGRFAPSQLSCFVHILIKYVSHVKYV